MKTRMLTASFMLGILAMPVLSYADADVDRSQPSSYVKDSVITTKIKAKLAAEQISSLVKINVDTDADGVVWLTGSVTSAAEADRAVAIASATEGVKAVKSELTIKPDR